jgi:hypothetical protein
VKLREVVKEMDQAVEDAARRRDNGTQEQAGELGGRRGV